MLDDEAKLIPPCYVGNTVNCNVARMREPQTDRAPEGYAGAPIKSGTVRLCSLGRLTIALFGGFDSAGAMSGHRVHRNSDRSLFELRPTSSFCASKLASLLTELTDRSMYCIFPSLAGVCVLQFAILLALSGCTRLP
jgi:hypothetical protein